MQTIIQTPFTNLLITASDEALLRVEFTQDEPTNNTHPLIKEAAKQLRHFFTNPNYPFNLPLAAAKTTFQQRVRQGLQAIPVGSSKTYQQLAKQLNTSPRAIGNACRATHFSIIVPCHRIVAINGLGGFNGKTAGVMLELKTKLLAFEAGQ